MSDGYDEFLRRLWDLSQLVEPPEPPSIVYTTHRLTFKPPPTLKLPLIGGWSP